MNKEVLTTLFGLAGISFVKKYTQEGSFSKKKAKPKAKAFKFIVKIRLGPVDETEGIPEFTLVNSYANQIESKTFLRWLSSFVEANKFYDLNGNDLDNVKSMFEEYTKTIRSEIEKDLPKRSGYVDQGKKFTNLFILFLKEQYDVEDWERLTNQVLINMYPNHKNFVRNWFPIDSVTIENSDRTYDFVSRGSNKKPELYLNCIIRLDFSDIEILITEWGQGMFGTGANLDEYYSKDSPDIIKIIAKKIKTQLLEIIEMFHEIFGQSYLVGVEVLSIDYKVREEKLSETQKLISRSLFDMKESELRKF